ncbi:MAG: Uncharacterized protein CEO21_122 [Microgenomates group bacterium Gr01-1014_80]|nr:MAG: Uncharacterized protein CEO21_122 [Microgenomates group bacterium Gr01-1014_80]
MYEGFWLVLAFGLIVGTILGSLAKALADRSLNSRSFLGRSYCPKCQQLLRWYDLCPVFSYLTLKGKCRYCQDRIGIEYLLVEAVTGLLIAFLFWKTLVTLSPAGAWQSQAIFNLIFYTFFITVLIILTITDLKKTLIPDRIIIPAIFISLVSLVIFTIYRVGYLYWYLNQSVIGKLLLPPHNDYFLRHATMAVEPLVYGILTGLGIGGFFLALIIITKGKGMGGGDVKLGAFMGLVLGFPAGILAVVLGFLTGAAVALGLIAFRKKHFGENIPFGPFLVIGSLISLFWGNQIMDWYINLSR